MKVQFDAVFTDKSDAISSSSGDVLNIIAEHLLEAANSYKNRGIDILAQDAKMRADVIKKRLEEFHYYESKDSVLNRISSTNIKNRGTSGRFVSREIIQHGGLYK